MRFITDNRVVEKRADHPGLRVIAAGLPRCATSSLQLAFENDLGLSPSMHMAHVAPHTDRLKACHAALLEPDRARRQAILRPLFDGYSATSDFPGALFVEDLVEMYPGARLVLNKRASADAWLRSVSRTLRYFSSGTFAALGYVVPADYWHHQNHLAVFALWKRRHGLGEVYVRETYELHNEDVRRIARERGLELLEWEPADGWGPLCAFLGVQVPDKPFPHTNDEKMMRRLILVLTARQLVAWAAVLGTPALACWWASKLWGWM